MIHTPVTGSFVLGDPERGIPAYIERGRSDQGWVYKNREAFYNDSHAVCYIPELSDDLYTAVDFKRLALGQAEIAEEVFLSVGWQEPETWLDEQFSEGEYNICSDCGSIYQSYGGAECPCYRKRI